MLIYDCLEIHGSWSLLRYSADVSMFDKMESWLLLWYVVYFHIMVNQQWVN